jgi:alpha-amylase/alpha-mannosidase (GH57 family)
MPEPRALCLHGHFYQPPREHPWLGVVEPERSAAPYRDWNTRITAECYAPNAAARILDGAGRLRALVNAYEWTSFNFGPTLLAWVAAHAPDVLAALRRADAASRTRTGFGNAWAQVYGHAILPLSTPHDVRTQVLWGRRDFEHRFGRAPDGMWLSEMAVDRTALTALADAGIALTMLAPHQARRVRPLGAPADAWRAVTAETLDTRRLYRCRLPSGKAVDIVFRDPGLSQDIAFGGLLADGAALAARLRDAVAGAPADGMVTVAVDGETYGHHHRFGEMALAFALEALGRDRGVMLVGPAAYRAAHPPADEVEIADATSWSCPHGVERWRSDCGCRVGGPPDWSQAWRAPLRAAIDWLRDELAVVYESRGSTVFRDPWSARDRYVDCLLEPQRADAWLAAEAARPLSQAGTVEARRLLEMARNALLMQTSCGWFFDELTGIEPVQILRYAARAIELAETLGRDVGGGFLERVEPARSNLPGSESGADLYRRAARGAAGTPARIAASAAMSTLLGEGGDVPGYTVCLSTTGDDGRLAGRVDVREDATGAETVVPISAWTDAAGAPICRAGEATFALGDLFGVQRERVLARIGRDAARAALDTVGRFRGRLDPLLDRDAVPPPEVATLLGWDGAHAIAAALEERTAPVAALVEEAARLRRRGAVFPARWLGARVAHALAARLAELPGAAAEALALLDLARAAGVRLDVVPAQVQTLVWWTVARPRPAAGEPLAALRDRLGIAPEAT